MLGPGCVGATPPMLGVDFADSQRLELCNPRTMVLQGHREAAGPSGLLRQTGWGGNSGSPSLEPANFSMLQI